MNNDHKVHQYKKLHNLLTRNVLLLEILLRGGSTVCTQRASQLFVLGPGGLFRFFGEWNEVFHLSHLRKKEKKEKKIIQQINKLTNKTELEIPEYVETDRK